jgi:hypothetical protein
MDMNGNWAEFLHPELIFDSGEYSAMSGDVWVMRMEGRVVEEIRNGAHISPALQRRVIYFQMSTELLPRSLQLQ